MKAKTESRLPVLIGTMLCQLGLGTLYAWSLFNAPLGKLFNWPVEDVAMCFSIGTLALALSTLFAGTLENKFGVRKVAIACGIVMGIGLIFAPHMHWRIAFYIFTGVVIGASNGIAYMMTLTNVIRWFPEKKGLIAGIVISCYGLGSLVFKYVDMAFIHHFGVAGAFVGWGVCAMVLVVIGGFLLKDAPEIVETTVGKAASTIREYTRKELLAAPKAWLLFIAFIASCLSGLYVIGVAKNIGISMAGLTPSEAETGVVMIAITNTIGRFVLGALSDHLPRSKVAAVAFAIIIASAVILLYVPLNYAWFLVSVGGIAFAFGGNLSIWSAMVGERFGINNSTKNYGLIYQGFGVGGILGGLIADVFHNLTATFYLVLVLAIIAFIIMVLIPSVRKNGQPVKS